MIAVINKADALALLGIGARSFPAMARALSFVDKCVTITDYIVIQEVVKAKVLVSASAGVLELDLHMGFDIFGSARKAIENLVISNINGFAELRQMGMTALKLPNGNIAIAVKGLKVTSATCVNGALMVEADLQ